MDARHKGEHDGGASARVMASDFPARLAQDPQPRLHLVAVEQGTRVAFDAVAPVRLLRGGARHVGLIAQAESVLDRQQLQRAGRFGE